MFQQCTRLLSTLTNCFVKFGCKSNKQCLSNHLKVVPKPGPLIQRMYSARFATDFGKDRAKKPSVNYSNILIQKARPCHARDICSFLNTHYWPREPSIRGLWMPLNSEYIQSLSDRYVYNPGMERYIAMEFIPRTKEYKMVGVLAASKKPSWYADELKHWGMATPDPITKAHVLFLYHCFRSSDLFNKYKVPYIYNIDLVCTSPEIAMHGVAQLLLRRALARAIDVRHPLVTMLCTNKYMVNSCRRMDMALDWAMNYDQLRDFYGKRLFYTHYPHNSVSILSRKCETLKAVPDKCDEPLLYEAFMQMLKPNKAIEVKRKTCFTRDNMRYSADKEPPRKPSFLRNCYNNIFSNWKLCPGKCYEHPSPS